MAPDRGLAAALRSLVFSCFVACGPALVTSRHRGSSGAASLRAAGAKGPVLVDFYVFLGEDADETGVAPRASCNIGGTDNETGFYRLCKSECPGGVVERGGATSPIMRFCGCVARLLVEDLSTDFGALLDAVPDAPNPLFELGSYTELDAGQDHFKIADGHGALGMLMASAPEKAYSPKSERLTVWIAAEIAGHSAHTRLAGTTYLDQPLYQGKPGAGVLLSADVMRAGRRLSHEVGHVVGFHHTAGAAVPYVYIHAQCPAEHARTAWKTSAKPSCEVNIMGVWYDGPYCCPSLLQLGSTSASGKECIENPPSAPKAPFCCGELCSHDCPKEMPPMKFATEEHKEMMSGILQCWLFLRGTAPKGASLAVASRCVHGSSAAELWGSPGGAAGPPKPPPRTAAAAPPQRAVVQCSDGASELGSCWPV